MITDLFSHKIHSSGPEWPDKLVELASIFSEFDGKVFDREAVETRLRSISPRVSVLAADVDRNDRDLSKFRDEITAYPAYLGLYWLQYENSQWIFRLSEAAKKFLLSEEPDIGAFMRLQLSLFQYPNGMGVTYSGDNAWVQHNARERTLELIKNGIHLSPFRFICRCLIADARLRDVDLFEAQVSVRELYALVNHSLVNTSTSPTIELLTESLKLAREGRISSPERFETRFHILDHTEMIGRGKGSLFFRAPENKEDREDLQAKIAAVAKIECQFDGFDSADSSDDIVAVVKNGRWGSYFDGLQTLSAGTVSILANDKALAVSNVQITPPQSGAHVVAQAPLRYSFKSRSSSPAAPRSTTRREELADPEATRIKRERRSLAHKKMVAALDELLRGKGADPRENPHVDLYAEIPNDGSYLFEVKSGGENLLSQIRKGVSQLYEYKFRYREDLRDGTTLCLVLPDAPTGIPWLEEYLCVDRGISLCWLDERGRITSASMCEEKMKGFLDASSEDSG